MADGGKLDLSQLRNLVRQYIDNHLYETALFWADKVCSLSKDDPQDIIWLAQSMFFAGQHRRAANLIKREGLISRSPFCKYLAAKCFAECKEWEKVLEVLEGDYKDSKLSLFNGQIESPKIENIPSPGRKIESAIWLLKGMAYEGLETNARDLAADAYKEALSQDVYCFEAFELLTSHHMLTAQEEVDLITSLPFSEQCSPEEAQLVKFVYESKIQKYSKPMDPKIPTYLDPLNDNLDVVVSLAERHFNNCDFKIAYKLTSAVMNSDLFHQTCLPVHISCLVELKKKNELYNLSKSLVASYPQRAISWYAIGSYYLLIGRNEQSRRYFGKATSINRIFAPAWLGFAHTYANEGEHDPAISAYFTASKLMPGSHLPFLYLGLEYVTTNNVKLAEHFFREALAISPDDAHVKHELGTVAYQNGNYIAADKYFKDALKRLETLGGLISENWESLFNNLGHVSRKLGRYEEALQYHKQALNVCPQNSTTYSSIGLIYCYMRNFHDAIPAFHKALSLNRDDTESTQLLNHALDNDAKESTLDLESNPSDTDKSNESTVEMEDSSMMEEE